MSNVPFAEDNLFGNYYMHIVLTNLKERKLRGLFLISIKQELLKVITLLLFRRQKRDQI